MVATNRSFTASASRDVASDAFEIRAVLVDLVVGVVERLGHVLAVPTSDFAERRLDAGETTVVGTPVGCREPFELVGEFVEAFVGVVAVGLLGGGFEHVAGCCEFFACHGRRFSQEG